MKSSSRSSRSLTGHLNLFAAMRGPHGQMAGLGFLAAEAAAHAPAFHAHAVVVDAQRMRHPVLHLARVLGAGIHQPLVLLLGHHVGDLPLQVEVLLAADLELAAAAVRARASPACASPRRTRTGGSTKLCAANASCTSAPRAAVRCPACHLARARPACLHHRVGHHQADDLADVLHRVDGKDGLVMGKRGQDRVAGDVAAPAPRRARPASPARRRIHALQPPCATGDRMGAACSVPRISAMSST
jgi:hypothetical protein